MPESILVVGATSGIGRALCHRLAEEGSRLIVAGRSQEALLELTAALQTRFGTEVVSESFDAFEVEDYGAFLDRCVAHADGGLNGVVLCQGYLPPPDLAWTDPEIVRQTIDVNLTSLACLLTSVATRLPEQSGSWIATISSVAGDRGRPSNYAYGSAKGGLSVFLQGLRARLHSRGIHVLTIKPGWVDTRMLRGTPAATSRLTASPERVAKAIHVAIRRRRNVLYTPWFWRPILWLLRLLPEGVFKRLKT